MSISNLGNTLVFSIGINGYGALYRSHIAALKRYASDHQYHYCCVSKPRISLLGLECVWLKIALLQRALQYGYEWVMFIDADAEIKPGTPPIQTLSVPGKSVYLAKGYSGKFNSGVIIVKNTPEAQQFFKIILDNAHQPIPAEDDVGWGENGHVIHYAHHQAFIQTIPHQWNNNRDPECDDFIRHYSRGPLFELFQPRGVDRLMSGAIRYWIACCKYSRLVYQSISNTKPQTQLQEQIALLANKVATHYPQFAQRSPFSWGRSPDDYQQLEYPA